MTPSRPCSRSGGTCAVGAGLGCLVTRRGRDLGGPIASDVKFDSRTGWTFEVRDRQTDEVLMKF